MILDKRITTENLSEAIAEIKCSKMISVCPIVPGKEIAEFITVYSKDRRERKFGNDC
jgi:hypothetical protein